MEEAPASPGGVPQQFGWVSTGPFFERGYRLGYKCVRQTAACLPSQFPNLIPCHSSPRLPYFASLVFVPDRAQRDFLPHAPLLATSYLSFRPQQTHHLLSKSSHEYQFGLGPPIVYSHSTTSFHFFHVLIKFYLNICMIYLINIHASRGHAYFYCVLPVPSTETEHNLMTGKQIASICLSHSKVLSVTEVAKVWWPARPCQGLV